jgi:ribonuclease HII
MVPPSIDECRALLESCPLSARGSLLATFDDDPRAGVRALSHGYRRREAALRAEHRRLDALMAREQGLHAAGCSVVAGVDEVGRGALAGPVTVAAVVLDPDCRIPQLDDSKRLTPECRERVAASIRAMAMAISVVHVEAGEIDSIGIGAAVRQGMERAVARLGVTVDHCLVDGNDGRLTFPRTMVVGGDRLCACIAAASVVAKVTRDALMRDYASGYPAFDFEVNKGYGTAGHVAAISRNGPTPLHRRSFAPCAQGPLFETDSG